MSKEISFIPNLSTQKAYSYAISTFKEYLVSIQLTDIPIELIDIPLNELSYDIFKGYKAFMDHNLSYGTIKYYFTLHPAFVAKAFEEDKTDFILSLKRFKLENRQETNRNE